MNKKKKPEKKTTKPKNQKYYYDRKAGQKVIKFIETFCRHQKGPLAGTTIKLEKWQKEIIMEGFSWKKTSDGFRKYRTIYVEVPKKNGKSTLAAPLALYLNCADGESGAEVYAAAGDKEQARIVFGLAKNMVEKDPTLEAAHDTFRDSIYHGRSMSAFKVVSAEAYTKEGINTHGLVFDEMHVQPNNELYDCFVTSTVGRTQPMTIIITTAGVRDTFGHQIHLYAKKVKDGILKDETYLSRIFCAEEGDDPLDPKTWAKANPNYGISIPKANMEEMAQRAVNEPSFYNTFLRYHLNIWTGVSTAFISHLGWEKCNYAPVDIKKLHGRECYGGLDLASTRDMTALVLLFPNPTGPDEVYCKFYCPEDTILEKTRKENPEYAVWAREGWLTTTPGNVCDYGFLKKDIHELSTQLVIKSIAYDRYNSSQVVQELIAEGVEMTPFGQGFVSMNMPTKTLEKMVLEKNKEDSINHGGNPILAWMNSNAQVISDAAGNIKLTKSKSKGKIDGMIGLVQALGEKISRASEVKKKNKYNNPDQKIISVG